jgi:hypothetical protein
MGTLSPLNLRRVANIKARIAGAATTSASESQAHWRSARGLLLEKQKITAVDDNEGALLVRAQRALAAR